MVLGLLIPLLCCCLFFVLRRRRQRREAVGADSGVFGFLVSVTFRVCRPSTATSCACRCSAAASSLSCATAGSAGRRWVIIRLFLVTVGYLVSYCHLIPLFCCCLSFVLSCRIRFLMVVVGHLWLLSVMLRWFHSLIVSAAASAGLCRTAEPSTLKTCNRTAGGGSCCCAQGRRRGGGQV